MIEAGVTELRQAFHAHQFNASGRCASHYLLLFYAAECGLKSLWLKRNRLRTTGQIGPALLTQGGHDLMLWAKALRLPATPVGTPIRFRLQRGGAPCEAHLGHQAWRYGIKIELQDEDDLVAWLRSLCERIKGEMRP